MNPSRIEFVFTNAASWTFCVIAFMVMMMLPSLVGGELFANILLWFELYKVFTFFPYDFRRSKVVLSVGLAAILVCNIGFGVAHLLNPVCAASAAIKSIIYSTLIIFHVHAIYLVTSAIF